MVHRVLGCFIRLRRVLRRVEHSRPTKNRHKTDTWLGVESAARRNDQMRWFRIRTAQIDPWFRQWFEQRGVDTMRAYLTVPFHIRRPDNTLLTEGDVRPPLMDWLTEQYDRVERKETWSLTMEVAITVFVAVELLFSILNFASRNPRW